MAIFVLVASPDVPTYEANRQNFWYVAIAVTVVYFVSAYSELRLRKAWRKKQYAEYHAEQSGSSRAMSA